MLRPCISQVHAKKIKVLPALCSHANFGEGMQATKFWSTTPPSDLAGYPPVLATAVASIAITTCILANGLLAHAATVSRNKLAEIVWTRRKLWRTIAQKENAEAAAAARSDFIASASHEIRTPLHHLQGYSDLLSRTELVGFIHNPFLESTVIDLNLDRGR